MSSSKEYSVMLSQLKTGQITPRSVVGTGYKYPKAVAAEWISCQIINAELPLDEKVSDVFGMRNGEPFKTIEKARASYVYKSLENGEFKTFSDLPVIDYGIRGGVAGNGHLVWMKVGSRKQLSKVA